MQLHPFETVKAKLGSVRAVTAFAIILSGLAGAGAWGQTTGDASPTTAGDRFRIGYLRSDPESRLGSASLYNLRDQLLSQEGFRRELGGAGFDSVDILSSDSHEDLVQRMGQNEFDLVFCTAKDFVSQKGDYEVVFQVRRPGDAFDARGQRVFHKGIVFVNNRSPLFTASQPLQLLAGRLAAGPVAMVSSYSAAGYVYPSLKLAAHTSSTLPSRILFCGSSEEVVKHVINGVSEIGACDAGVLEEVLRQGGIAGRQDELVRVILETDPIPTDPVVFRSIHVPRVSPLGRQLQDAMRALFARDAALPRLESSSNGKYEDMRRNIAAFEAMAR
jgi:ABC-type phosphate/phosphonate transport system substrate-binding protein